MKKKISFGDEVFECSKCLNIVDEFDDICDICGREFLSERDYSNKENKHKAINYSIQELNGKEVFVTSLDNISKGIIEFILPLDSLVAMRVRSSINNSNAAYLEDDVPQKILIEYEDYILTQLEGKKYYISKELLNKNNSNKSSSNKVFIKPIKQLKVDNIFHYNENWIDLNYSLNYKNALKECISYIRPEMFFYDLYSTIIHFEFEIKSISIPSNYELLKIYEEASKEMLKEYCSIIIDKKNISEVDSSQSFRSKTYFVNYCRHIELLKSSTLYYANCSCKIKDTIDFKSTDWILTSQGSLFFQNLMIMGARMSHTRLLNELDNESIFGCEIIQSLDYKELIIYLTPNGMRNLTAIFKFPLEEKLEIFNVFLRQNNIQRVDDKSLNNEFNTELILVYQHLGYKHYTHSGNYLNNFMSDRINRKFLSSVLQQGQVNCKQILFP